MRRYQSPKTVSRQSSKLSARIATGLAVVCALFGTSAPAFGAPTSQTLSAAERDAGLWYVNAMGIDAAHQAGLTGKGVRIAVVDTGINLKAAELQGANIKVHDGFCLNQDDGGRIPGNSTDSRIAEHGTGVVAMLVGNGTAEDGGKGTVGIVPDAQIDFYAVGPLTTKEEAERGWSAVCPSGQNGAGEFEGDSWESAMNAAVASDARFVTVSLSGSGTSFKDALAVAAGKETTVIASVLNPGSGSAGIGIFPAAGNGTVAVNAIGSDGKVIGESEGPVQELPYGRSNMGVAAPGVRILVPGPADTPIIEHGTSTATPLVAGALALASQKYPQATNGQLVQALIHTTQESQRGGALNWNEELGYGIVSLPKLLATTPMDYPNGNPLFVTSVDDPRCLQVGESNPPASMNSCRWANTPQLSDLSEKTTKPSAIGDENSNRSDLSFVPWLILIAVVGVLAAGAVTVILFRANRRRRHTNSN